MTIEWEETPDEKYQDAETDNVSFSKFRELTCRQCDHGVMMALQPEDFRPRWRGDCPECGAHYSAYPTEVVITQSDGDL